MIVWLDRLQRFTKQDRVLAVAKNRIGRSCPHRAPGIGAVKRLRDKRRGFGFVEGHVLKSSRKQKISRVWEVVLKLRA